MKNSFSKILVCYDGSKYADKALLMGISLAEKFNSKLFVLSVIEKNTIDFWDNSEYVEIVSKSLMYRKKEIKKLLDKKLEKIKECIDYEIFVVEGHVLNELLKYGKKNSVGIVIVGNRGLGGFKKMLMGSISRSISENSQCSVLIVK